MRRKHWWTALLAVVILGSSGWLIGYLLTPLPPPELPQASQVLAANGEIIARIGVENRVVVPLEQMPSYLLAAVVAQEDHRFYRHFGIDPISIVRAAVQNFRAGTIVEGGSTLTQQLARTWYLTMQRTFLRKLEEALLALRIETHFSKDEILGHYLNSIYMGHGAWGMEAAAQVYFGKSVRDINLAEAALLAGIIGAPERFTPHRHPDLARRRQLTVLQRMVEHGYIDPATAAAARQAAIRFAPPPAAGQQGLAADSAYFVDYVRSVLRERAPQVAADLDRAGYRIFTTLEPDLQRAAVQRLREGLDVPAAQSQEGLSQPQGALVAMDPTTGYIKALVGGRDFAASPFNRAYQARRQPGSAFKVFVYTAALAAGHPPTATQVCEPVEYPGAAGGEPYRPQDYQAEQGRPYHYQYLTMRQAISISDNVVAVRWAQQISPRTVAGYAYRMGINPDTPLEATLPLALGASTVTPLELTRAYATLANLGYRVDPIAVLRVETPDGRVVFEQKPQQVRVLDEGIAYVMNDLLKSVLDEGGTGEHLRAWFWKPAAAKSGTSNQLRNAWFVGYTPRLVTTVYVGNDDESPLWGTGATIAGPIWARFMADATAGQPALDWERPPNVTTAVACVLTGSAFAPVLQAVEEVFVEGTVPAAEC